MHDMVLQTENDRILVYIKAKNEEYFRYTLFHCVNEYTDGGLFQNQDLWRLYQLRHYIFKNGTFQQGLPYEIVTNGEWECAIQIAGTPDFHGGLHGYERYTTVCAWNGDQEHSLHTPSFTQAEAFVFEQESKLYLQGSKDDCIALHTKRYHFSKDGLVLRQRIVWERSLPVRYAYLAMLPIRRTSNDAPDGMPITETAACDYDNIPYDVSAEGHQTMISPSSNRKQNVTNVKIWSERSNLYAEMQIDCALTDTNSFFIQNTPAYNKLYFSYAGNGDEYQTSIGEEWEITSQYTLKLLK